MPHYNCCDHECDCEASWGLYGTIPCCLTINIKVTSVTDTSDGVWGYPAGGWDTHSVTVYYDSGKKWIQPTYARPTSGTYWEAEIKDVQAAPNGLYGRGTWRWELTLHHLSGTTKYYSPEVSVMLGDRYAVCTYPDTVNSSWSDEYNGYCYKDASATNQPADFQWDATSGNYVVITPAKPEASKPGLIDSPRECGVLKIVVSGLSSSVYNCYHKDYANINGTYYVGFYLKQISGGYCLPYNDYFKPFDCAGSTPAEPTVVGPYTSYRSLQYYFGYSGVGTSAHDGTYYECISNLIGAVLQANSTDFRTGRLQVLVAGHQTITRYNLFAVDLVKSAYETWAEYLSTTRTLTYIDQYKDGASTAAITPPTFGPSVYGVYADSGSSVTVQFLSESPTNVSGTVATFDSEDDLTGIVSKGFPDTCSDCTGGSSTNSEYLYGGDAGVIKTRPSSVNVDLSGLTWSGAASCPTGTVNLTQCSSDCGSGYAGTTENAIYRYVYSGGCSGTPSTPTVEVRAAGWGNGGTNYILYIIVDCGGTPVTYTFQGPTYVNPCTSGQRLYGPYSGDDLTVDGRLTSQTFTCTNPTATCSGSGDCCLDDDYTQTVSVTTVA